MTVSFFGHRTLDEQAQTKESLSNCISLLLKDGATCFLLGDYGEFERLCARILQERREQYPQIRLIYVQAYLERTPVSAVLYDEFLYPDLEKVPKKYAIVRRNEWMIRQSDVVVIHCRLSYGGAAAAFEYAKRKSKRILFV